MIKIESHSLTTSNQNKKTITSTRSKEKKRLNALKIDFIGFLGYKYGKNIQNSS